MKPSQYIKSMGVPSMAALSRASGLSELTLARWHKSRPATLKLLCYGYLYSIDVEAIKTAARDIDK